MLTDYTHMIEPRPNEWLLLCRFADTIGIEHGSRELRELRQLAEYLDKSCFEGLNGYVNPVVATEIEKEIILRSTPYYAHGLGHDIAPAVRLLKDYEQNGPVFTQAERNLILTHAYFMGSIRDTEQIAGRMAAHDFSNRDIASACIAIEVVNLEWSGLGQMEGLEMGAAKCPTLQFSFENCEDPMKVYPRFAFYPTLFPHGGELLQNGVVIRPCPDAPGRWQSDLWNVFLFWFFDRVGEGWRLAGGADVVEQAMGMVSRLGPLITRNPLPSFHPQDLLVGLIGAVAVRLAVYFKAQNAKKYRRGVEYGSARWGGSKDIAPFINPKRNTPRHSPRPGMRSINRSAGSLPPGNGRAY